MFVNDRPDSDFFCSVVALSGWSDGPTLTRDVNALPQVLGVVPASFATMTTRQITVDWRLTAATLAEREARLTARLDSLAGLLKLAWEDHPTRHMRAVAGPRAILEIVRNAQLYMGDVIIRQTFWVYDGASYANDPVVLAVTATPAPLSFLGDLPAPGMLYVTGALSAGVSRVITYRSFNGIPYGSMTITPPASPAESLGSTDWLEMSLLRRSLTKVSGGVRTNVAHWMTAGDWFCPDPADCDRERGAFPTLAIDTGAASYVCRPAWSH